MMGQQNTGVGHQHWGRVVSETSQGKDRELGGPVSLVNRKEVHQNVLYWEQVDQSEAAVPV